MLAILKNEWRSGLKSLLIWALAVSGMGFICILLFKSMEDSMAGMADNFASMGAFAEAFGMNTLSIATMKGYFATEIGTIHALGGSMFAATIATVIFSKEEDQHTTEFTFALPVSRGKIITMKILAVILNIVCFTVICGLVYELGLLACDESLGSDFLKYMLLQLLMNVEIAAICFVISAVSRSNKLGLGISIPLFLYVYDIMARAVSDLKDAIFITPFSYSNATSIFAGNKMDTVALLWGGGVIFLMTIGAGLIYHRRDLSA